MTEKQDLHVNILIQSKYILSFVYLCPAIHITHNKNCIPCALLTMGDTCKYTHKPQELSWFILIRAQSLKCPLFVIPYAEDLGIT